MAAAILSVVYSGTTAQAAEQNYDTLFTTFNVIHAFNYHPETQVHGNKMAVKLEGNDVLYPLNNLNSTDSLVYTGTADIPLLFDKYKYVVVDQNNKEVHSEPFYRHLDQRTDGAYITPYEFYGRQPYQQNSNDLQPQPALPQVDWRYKGAKKEYQYKWGLDRSQVHPVNEIPTWHIQTNPADFETLREKILEDIGITANVTRIMSNHMEQFKNVKIELSGQTSRLFKKLSYSVHIDKEGSINGYRRFKLRSCATDPSYMREKLFYDILDASKLPTAKASFVR